MGEEPVGSATITLPPGEAGGSPSASAFCCCCCCSVAKSCLTLCDPMDCSTPGLPALRYLLEFAQTRVHGVSDAVQPSHPLSPPSPPAFAFENKNAILPAPGFSSVLIYCTEASSIKGTCSIGYFRKVLTMIPLISDPRGQWPTLEVDLCKALSWG